MKLVQADGRPVCVVVSSISRGEEGPIKENKPLSSEIDFCRR